jgi:transcriptional regulator with XRE-family HTH domain
MARHRSGLSQEELAIRSGKPRSTIARWESGARSPSLESLEEVIGAAGLDLTVSLANRDASLEELVNDQLALKPEDRLRRLLPAGEAKALLQILGKLATVGSPAIVIGSIAGALQGAPQRPRADAVEVVPRDRDGFLKAIESQGAKPTDDDERFNDVGRRWRWSFGAADVIVADRLAGASGYRDLRRSAVPLPIKGHDLSLASPRDLLRLAEASPSEGDRAYVPGLRALLEASSKSARI